MEKIIELIIDEQSEISGIQAISIVENPAIDCCDKFSDLKRFFKEFDINSLLVFLSHPMPIHNTGGCQVVS